MNVSFSSATRRAPATIGCMIRREPALPLAAALLLFFPALCFGWGPVGHRAVGRIAEQRLSPPVAREVAALLDGQRLAYVGTWSDEIRSDPAWKRAEPWHYVNIPEGTAIESAERNPAGDVLEAIDRFAIVLADRARPKAERAEALRWLTHLVGDLHQPLHVGYGSDRGGNEIVVLWFGEANNLHAVWDDGLIDGRKLSSIELAELALSGFSAAQLDAWRAGTALDWAQESRSLLPGIYDLGDRRLGFAYLSRHWPTVERRIVQAGVRLAALLERQLGERH